MPERSVRTVAVMVGNRRGVQLARRLLSVRLAIALGVLALLLNIASLVLLAAAHDSAPQVVRLVGLLPTVAVGTLIAVRRPGNPIGWLMLGAALCFAVTSGATAYSVLDYGLHHGTLPFGRLSLGLQPAWAPGLVMIAGCLWLFPDGHLPSGRRRRVGGTLFAIGLVYAVVVFVPSVLAAASRNLQVDPDGAPSAVAHPVGQQLVWVVVENIGFFAVLVSWVVWLVVQVPKYRRSAGERRQQLKWLYSGAAVFIICLGIGLFQSTAVSGAGAVVGAAIALGVAALPVALGIGILKYRLYDIDRIISRTLAYAILTGLLVGVYAGLVLLATEVLGLHSTVAVAAATLAAAALFNPLRRQVQRVVDRRFNRAQYDAEATVAAFAGRLRESVELASVEHELAAAVDQVFEPSHISVWLDDRAP
jgi:hypothetical protein